MDDFEEIPQLVAISDQTCTIEEKNSFEVVFDKVPVTIVTGYLGIGYLGVYLFIGY